MKRYRRPRCTWFGSVVCVVSASLPGIASAEPTAQNRAIAETLFREGRALVAAAKISEACPKFTESHKLDPQLGTLMYAATCHEQEGKTATAWIEFSEALALARQSKQRDREKLAEERVTALESRLSRITVVVENPVKDMVVKLDSVTLAATSVGVALPVDPGDHRLEATAPGIKPLARTIAVSEASTQEARLQLEALPAITPRTDTAPPPPAPAEAGNRRVLGYVLGGAGVVTIGLGTFFGLRAVSQNDSADKECSGRFCTQSGLDEHDAAGRSALVSTIGFAVGAAAVTAAVYFIFFDKPRAAAASITAHGLRF